MPDLHIVGAWMSTTAAAAQIGVNASYLRKLCRADPPLEHRMAGDSYQVQPAAAFDYIRAHARRLPAGLREPPGYAQPAPAPEPLAAADSPHALLLRCLTDPAYQGKFTGEQQRTFAALAAELRRKDESDAKSLRGVQPDHVIEMLQDHRALFVELLDESALADATELLRHIGTQFGVDLRQVNVAAPAMLEKFLRERANKFMARLAERVEEQCRGVRLLNIGAGT